MGEQLSDMNYCAAFPSVGKAKTPFDVDHRGLLVQDVSPKVRSQEILPTTINARIFYFCNFSISVAAIGGDTRTTR